MTVLCSFDTCRFFDSVKCLHPRKKENGGKFILPVFRPNETCIWGKSKFDVANFIRSQIAIEDAKRNCPKAMHCGPACKYWIYLYYRSENDFEAICDHPDRKGMGLPIDQICRVAVPINRDLV